MRRLLAAWLLFLVTAAWSAAQIPTTIDLDYNPLLLLNQKVHTELRLSPTGAQKVQNTVMQEFMKMLPSISSNPKGKPLTNDQRIKAVFKSLTQMQVQIAKPLTPLQRIRLHQLTLQSIGPSAVLQPKVAKELALTPTQKKGLGDAISAANERLQERISALSGKSATDYQRQMRLLTQLQNEAKAQGKRALMATLTPTQKSKWKAMLGKPFPLSGFLGTGGMLPGMG